jgi:hypothetical protein
VGGCTVQKCEYGASFLCVHYSPTVNHYKWEVQKTTYPLVILDFILFFIMLEFGLVWLGVVLAAAAERGLLDREELAGEFLAPISSPQGRQGPDEKGTVS